jgi:sigma54-dependent transcription regulator
MSAAQAKLLSEATEQVFQLQTQKKENQHKIDRLHDYERQIEQHLKIQKLWFGVQCSRKLYF